MPPTFSDRGLVLDFVVAGSAEEGHSLITKADIVSASPGYLLMYSRNGWDLSCW